MHVGELRYMSTNRKTASLNRIDDLLRELSELMFQDDSETDEPTGVLSAWSIVTEWRIPGREEPWINRGWALGMSPAHAFGLYHEALYGDWSPDDD